MEIENLNELYRKLKKSQIDLTTNFLYENIGRHKTILDLSNKYLFERSLIKLKSLIGKAYSTQIPIKTLILQNCMLSAFSASTILSIFLNFSGKICLSQIDLGNNSINLNVALAGIIAKVLEKSSKSDHKSIILKGNMIQTPDALKTLLKCQCPIDYLSLYDCYLQPESLNALSESISDNKNIRKLDISYNSQAFISKSITYSLGMSIGLNTHLAVLKLSGNSPLSKKSLLRKLCIGLKHSSSIEKLFIGNVPLQNSGMNILRKNLKNMNIEKLDIQNNNISSKSFIKFIHDLPFALNTLIATYNNFDDSKILKEIGNMLMTQRNLRQLNISYCLNFSNFGAEFFNAFCQGIARNRSLTEFLCEGCKIGEDPDRFCRMISQTIESRNFVMNYKISAANYINDSNYLSKTQERIITN